MNKAIALLVVGIAALAVLLYPAPSVKPVEDAKVNAKIDARLHQVLTGLALKRGGGHAAAASDWSTVRIAGR